ncbi:MAG TPA: right-handed parallel beta-helix repeat-containing protein [Thermoanaerobaculia bacterium]|jgi:hypothetical protein|nr:right-handed parallel beta-helix repeat-containing protein [Thermoanaerobaculia bacterium]
MSRTNRFLYHLSAGLATALLGIAPAVAADGVVEIDAACVGVGCFPGDSPGFPVEITNPGSYKLTSNLDARVAGDVDAIRIAAVAVTLDLAGFQLISSSVCSGGTTNTCSPVNNGAGVRIVSQGAVVRNGSITGFGHGIVSSADFTRLQDLTVWSNSVEGIFAAQAGNQIVGVSAYGNGSHGIEVGAAGMVRRSTAYGNGGRGIFAFGDNLLIDNSIYGNRMDGITGGGFSIYARNVIAGNHEHGLHDTAGGSLVFGNAVSSNAIWGLLFDVNTSAYSENVLSGNGATIFGGGSLLQNACNGAAC